MHFLLFCMNILVYKLLMFVIVNLTFHDQSVLIEFSFFLSNVLDISVCKEIYLLGILRYERLIFDSSYVLL